jgi:hypothetical protein
LDTIVKAHPEYELTVLLRNAPDKLAERYPNVKVVKATYDDFEIVADTAAQNDIVVRKCFSMLNLEIKG